MAVPFSYLQPNWGSAQAPSAQLKPAPAVAGVNTYRAPAPTTPAFINTGTGGRTGFSAPAPVSNPSANLNQPTNNQPQGPSAQDQLNGQIRGEINSGFDAYTRSLDEQLGLLPEHYQNLQDQVSQLHGDQLGTINTANTQQTADLNRSDQKVDENQATSFRDLSENFQQALDAGNAKLGSFGASDSSAAPMYSYALGLQANKNRGNLQAQANGLHNDISLKKNQLGATINDEVQKLDTWKNSQLTGLSQWLNDQKSKFATAKGQTEEQRQQALASLDQSALQRLQQLDDQHTQYKEGLVNWALNHKTALDSTLAYVGKQNQIQVLPFEQQALNTALQPVAGGNGITDIFGGSQGVFGKKGYDQYGNPTG